MSLNLETPLGFATFLANASNQRKVFVPSSFNMSSIIKSLGRQESTELVCDKDFYELEAPGPMAEEYKAKCKAVQSAIVAGSGSVNSSLFSAKATVIDQYQL